MKVIEYLPYSPSITLEKLTKILKGYRKVKHSPYRWWRWYDKNREIKSKSILSKIENGDYNNEIYFYQAQLCEHLLNNAWIESKNDIGKYNQEVKILRQRKERLYDDFYKNETKDLEKLKKDLSKELKMDIGIIEREMEIFDGTTKEFYFHLCKVKPEEIDKLPLMKLIKEFSK